MDQFRRDKTPIYEGVNPFLSAWYEPRVAARHVIETKTFAFPIILAIISGLISMGAQSFTDNPFFHTDSSVYVLFKMVGGVVGGVFGWIVGAFFMMLFGKIFGGKATFKEMALAISVGYIPTLALGIIIMLDLIIIGPNMVNAYVTQTGGELAWLLFSSLLKFGLSVWGTVVSIKAISEAHRFSSWRGLGTVLIPTVIVLSLVFFFFFVVIGIVGFAG